MTLRVVSYNIQRGRRLEEVGRVLATLQADVLLLQEVVHPGQLLSLGNILGLETRFLAESNTFQRVGLLSHLPLVDARSHRRFPWISQGILAATLRTRQGRPLHLLGVHLIAFALLPFEGWRYRELNQLLPLLRRVEDECCLLGGDFNALTREDRVAWAAMPPGRRLLLRIQGRQRLGRAMAHLAGTRWVDCYRHLHSGCGYTKNTRRPQVRIDYLFASPALAPTLASCRVAAASPAAQRASDHFPLLADFEL